MFVVFFQAHTLNSSQILAELYSYYVYNEK